MTSRVCKYLVAVLAAVLAIETCSPDVDRRQVKANLPVLPYGAELQAAIEQALCTARVESLGISVAVSVPGYRLWRGVSGYSHPGVPVTSGMLFDVGSIEKNFQAALVLKLAEEGRLFLDNPIGRYLPSLRHVDGTITIRQLLNHTSGLFSVFEHPDFPWVGAGVEYSKRWALQEVFDAFVLEPYGPPGEVQHYSSTNYLLLTAIMKEVTGSTVPEEIERYFLRPLQLEHTFVSMGAPPPGDYPVAHPWVDADLDGTLEDLFGIPLTWKVSLTHPVMFSTPSDLVRWVCALNQEQTVLRPSSLEEMLAMPLVRIRDPEGGRYGLGVVDFTDRLGVPVIGHAGAALGYSGAALYLPEQQISLAWLINTGESPADLAGRLMGRIWSALFEVIQESG